MDVERLEALSERILARLVAIPSENPPGGEMDIAHFVGQMLQTSGYSVEYKHREKGRTNVLAKMRRGHGRSIILQSHLDTKPAGIGAARAAWMTDPFVVTRVEDRLYGLGAADAKGGLAANLAAATVLSTESDWCGELIVVGSADEEDGSGLGAEFLLDRGDLVADAAVVSEPTGGLVSVSQLGNAWVEVRFVGAAGHAGRPEQAVDAFRAAAAWIALVDSRLASGAGHRDFPGHPRLNVGDIMMPGHPGSVPGECRLRCDIRVMPGEKRSAVHEIYLRCANELASDKIRIEVREYAGGGCESHELDPSHPLVRTFAGNGGLSNGARFSPFFGGSDARYFHAAGTPAIVFGPGDLGVAHAPNEFVPRGELHAAAKVMTKAVRSWLSRP